MTKEGVELREGGILGDLAPTMLDLLDVQKPEEMTGRQSLRRKTNVIGYYKTVFNKNK